MSSKIRVVRVLDGATIFEMAVGPALDAAAALEIAYDIVVNAADWYDTGDSPWRVEVELDDNVPFESAPVAGGSDE
jgi:hypothetical protein